MEHLNEQLRFIVLQMLEVISYEKVRRKVQDICDEHYTLKHSNKSVMIPKMKRSKEDQAFARMNPEE